MFALHSYYPLHPPADDVNLDYEQFEKHALLPYNPDILILPSDLRYFAKVLVMHINGSLLCCIVSVMCTFSERNLMLCLKPGRGCSKSG